MKLRHFPHYTYEDYLKWQGDWELIEGFPYAMALPRLLHQVVLSRLVRLLGDLIEKGECGCEAVVEVDWVISEDTVVRPDLSVICEGFQEDYVRKAPLLVVEVVSESSRLLDEEVKRELYQQQGVRYYLLLYPETKTFKVFENLQGKFAPKEDLNFEIKNCSITLDLDRVWR